jgi:hypothetical protein
MRSYWTGQVHAVSAFDDGGARVTQYHSVVFLFPRRHLFLDLIAAHHYPADEKEQQQQQQQDDAGCCCLRRDTATGGDGRPNDGRKSLTIMKDTYGKTKR